jgi:hypothetical protein
MKVVRGESKRTGGSDDFGTTVVLMVIVGILAMAAWIIAWLLGYTNVNPFAGGGRMSGGF